MIIPWQKAVEKNPSIKEFLGEIIAQVPNERGERDAFELALDRLASFLPPEVENKLAKLQALENHGVDNWGYYDDAMEELRDGEEEDD